MITAGGRMCTCRVPPGASSCHCAACCRTFAGLTSFERHQRLDGGVRCLDPAGLGLVLDGRGVWGTPEGIAARSASAARLAAVRAGRA